MCNINLIIRKDGKPTHKLIEYMNTASWHSYTENDDGEGYIEFDSNNHHVKSMDKSLNKFMYQGKANVILTHQRKATSGTGKENAHPHETENFLFMHNGVFWGKGNKEVSDSAVYLTEFESEYEQNNNNIITTIKKMHDDKHIGSYSCFIFEKRTNKLYYYKNDSTKMYYLNTKEYLIMSTKRSNVMFAKMFFKINSEIIEVKSDIIFDVFDNFKQQAEIKAYVFTNHVGRNANICDYDYNWMFD